MLAVTYSAHSSPDTMVFQSVPKPIPSSEEVLVKINVAAINPVDGLVIKGYMNAAGWKVSFPFIPGYDFAGVVENVGSNVTSFKVGDRVAAVNWGYAKHDSDGDPIAGAFAEYISIPAKKLSLIPEPLSDDIAAAVQLVGTTAWQGLDNGKVGPSSRVLIIGGSSTVGSIGIQLAKLRGAWVATTCSTKNIDYVKQWGADLIIDYSCEKWEENSSIQNIDFVFDTVGEPKAFERAFTKSGLFAPSAAYVSIANGEVGYNPAGHPPLTYAALMCLSNDPAIQNDLMKLIVEGKLKVPIDQAYPFTQEGVLQAFEKVDSKKSLGKNIIKMV